MPFSVLLVIWQFEILEVCELFRFALLYVDRLVIYRLFNKPLHSGQTRVPHSSHTPPLLHPNCGFVSVRRIRRLCLSRALCRRRLPQSSAPLFCVSVFTVPPAASFPMNLTSKHSCVCLHFFGMFTHFFHVLRMT